MKRLKLIFTLLLGSWSMQAAPVSLRLSSPDKKTELKISVGEQITYSLWRNDRQLLAPSSVAMELYDGTVWGEKPQLVKQNRRTVEQTVHPLYGANSVIADRYNELELLFRGGFGLVFRAYDEGVAFRFTANREGNLKIRGETTSFVFPENTCGYYRKGNINNYMYEPVYEYSKLSGIDSGRVAALPVVVQTPAGPKIGITESDIDDYPGMYLHAVGDTLKSCFRAYPLKTNDDKTDVWAVWTTEWTDYIAETNGKRTFPWRVLMVADDDAALLNNELVYLLASERSSQIDFAFVKPGMIANDWWNFRYGAATGVQEVILTGVDFKSGTNFDSYKFFIDYALDNGIPYVNMDYGWCNPHDFSQIHPHLDLPRVLAYSKEKKVPVFLWCIAKTLMLDLDRHLKMFADWGVAGLKVDFLERDDQVGINIARRIAESAARHGLMVEYHGSCNPAGLSRTWPNILTFESVYGSEQNFGSDKVTPAHNVTIPFIRSLSGPFDYAPGSMDNKAQGHFHPTTGTPVTQGTRAHQVAMFVIYYSPLQFTVDVPTNYLREKESLDFITSIPVTWDKTVPLQGKIGEYAVMARKKGATWYVAAMTDWNARDLTVGCDFLEPACDYQVEIFKDGLNADKNGNDYKTERIRIRQGEKITLQLAPGGGWTARFTPLDDNIQSMGLQ